MEERKVMPLNPSYCGPYDQIESDGPNGCPPMRLKRHHGRMNDKADLDDGRLTRVDGEF